MKVFEAFDQVVGTRSWVVDAAGDPVQGVPVCAVPLSALREGALEVDGHRLVATQFSGPGEGGRWLLSHLSADSGHDPGQLALLQRQIALVQPEPSELGRELDEMRNMFQMVLDTIPVRVFWKDRDCVVLGGNRLFANDAGLDGPEELAGRSTSELWPEEGQRYVTDDRAVMNSGEAKVDYEEPQTQVDGQRIWLQTSKIPLRDTGGEIIGILGTYADITPRKQAQAERERLLKDLESKNGELERFAYTVSHDLKSPLVTIQGFLGVLDEDIEELDEAAAETASSLSASVARLRLAAGKMHRLLDELLEMSRVGRILNPKTATTLGAIMADVRLLCHGAIEESGAEIEMSGEGHRLFVDAPRIVQVLQNLVDNACKYRSSDRPLLIRIELDGSGALRFADNGIGIDEKYRERVFRAFEKLDPATRGSGIGLALVKRIIENHGGTVHIEGAEPGAAFVFNLPTAEAEQS